MGKKDRIKKKKAQENLEKVNVSNSNGESSSVPEELQILYKASGEIEKFMSEIQPIQQNRESLQSLMGYCLSGERLWQAFVWRGTGSNGKTTVAKMLKGISPFTVFLNPDILYKKRSCKDLVNIIGRSTRCLIVDDFPADKNPDPVILSTIIDETTAKIIIITNRMTDFDVGEFKDRMIYVPFQTKFV